MTKIEVPSTERGVVRVFELGLEGEAARGFAHDPGRVAAALGADEIDIDHVEAFPLSDLAEMRLVDYLSEGYGIEPAEMAADASRLGAIDGWVAIVASPAFGGRAQTITPRAPLSLVASFAEDIAPPRFEDLPSGGAEGIVVGSPGDAPPVGRSRGPMIVLLILVAIVVAVFALRFGGGG